MVFHVSRNTGCQRSWSVVCFKGTVHPKAKFSNELLFEGRFFWFTTHLENIVELNTGVHSGVRGPRGVAGESSSSLERRFDSL